jgi:F-type H+-transporting ATPase subunit epsilon
MATFSFELVSPTRLVFSGEVDEVDVPGAEGDFGVLAGHAPLIAALRPGIVTIRQNGSARRLYVRDGFAEVNPAGLTLLAEFAISVEELDEVVLQKDVEAAEARLSGAAEGAERDKAVERLEQLKQVRAQLGALSQSAH